VELGDIVEFDGIRWKVASFNVQHRTCLLTRFDGPPREVPDDLDTHPEEGGPSLTVLFNPAKTWGYVTAPLKTRGGRMVELRRNFRVLVPMMDWVPGDFHRPGGAIFLNPELEIHRGEILAVRHANGNLSRVAVTGNFGTVHHRVRAATYPAQPRDNSAWGRISRDEDPFGD
jgi:hypothetical protein